MAFIYESLMLLDETQKYFIKAIHYETHDSVRCSNCNKPITNVVTIIGLNNNKLYTIGLDCYDRLREHNKSDIKQDNIKIEKFNEFKRCISAFSTKIKETKENLKYSIYPQSGILKIALRKVYNENTTEQFYSQSLITRDISLLYVQEIKDFFKSKNIKEKE